LAGFTGLVVPIEELMPHVTIVIEIAVFNEAGTIVPGTRAYKAHSR
jgi:hypothetical protein